MLSVIELTSYAGCLLLLLTAWSSIRAAYRLRDPNHLNVLYVTGAFAWAFALKGQARDVPVECSHGDPRDPALPGVRLVQQFLDVPAVIERGSIGRRGRRRRRGLGWAPRVAPRSGHCHSHLGGLAANVRVLALAREAARTKGVTARRLSFASVGALAFGVFLAFVGVAQWAPSLQTEQAWLDKVLSSTVLFCYYIAFADAALAQKPLAERREHSRYLSHTPTRTPRIAVQTPARI